MIIHRLFFGGGGGGGQMADSRQVGLEDNERNWKVREQEDGKRNLKCSSFHHSFSLSFSLLSLSLSLSLSHNIYQKISDTSWTKEKKL